MDLGDILRTIGRRWYIMLPIALVTVALTTVAYLKIPMKYESTSQISLLSPQQPASGSYPGQSNPFLIFDTSLTSTADLLARNLSSAATVKELAAMGVTEQYTAKLADFAQGPFIALTVTGTDKNHVLASSSELTGFAQDRLQEIQRQNGVPANNMIKTTVMIPPQPPQPQLKNKLQNVVALFAAGMVAAFISTFITEGLARSRRRNRSTGTVLAAAPASEDWTGPSVDVTQAIPRVDTDRTMTFERPADLDLPRKALDALDPPLDRLATGHRAAPRAWSPDPPTDVLLGKHPDSRPTNHNGVAAEAAVYRSASASGRGEDADPHIGN